MNLPAFSWVIEGSLAGMAMPHGTDSGWRELRCRGIGAVVNLTPKAWPADLLGKHDLAGLHLPIPDFAPPSSAQVSRFVAFCDRMISTGRPVVVHCVAGRGRTGTMIACYLVSIGMEAGEAMDYVRRQRPGSIETAQQEEAVRAFGRSSLGCGSTDGAL